MLTATSFWSKALPAETNPDWMAASARFLREAQDRRRFADYDTGSIAEEEAYLLRAIAEHISARVVIEVGTFIGTSAIALASASSVEVVFTCDASNDCFQRTARIHTYPKQRSQHMLRDLVHQGVRADLCFFDGVLDEDDRELLLKVTTPDTVYAFHDYNYGPKIRKHGVLETVPRKGIGNVRLLTPNLPRHELVEPRPGTTLALLVPESRL